MFRLTSLLAVLVGCGQVSAGPIESITPRNSNGVPTLVSNGLFNGVEAYVDRTDQKWIDLPAYLVGVDYVRMANDDKSNPYLELDVELIRPADLCVFVNDVTYGGGPIPWMADGTLGFTFADTGDNLTRYARGFYPSRIGYSVYSARVPEGTVTLLWNHHSTTNGIYGVAAIPEPSTLILLTMGAVGLLAYGWRRRK